MDFLAIDFETANSNNNSACSLGMVFVSRHLIMHRKHFFIKPPGLKFDAVNTKIHGISAEDVKNAPTFEQVWKEISHFFHPHCLLVAHNAQFDMNVLKNCLAEYDLKEPTFDYFCSMSFTEPICEGSNISKSLKNRADYFGIDIGDHHNALSDAEVCAQLVMKSIEMQNKIDVHSYIAANRSVPVKPFSELKVQKKFIKKDTFKKDIIKISELVPTVESISTAHPLFGKTIAFTGDLETLERKEAMQHAVNVGAFPKTSIVKKTNYLVVGTQNSTQIGLDGVSSKERKASEMLDDGFNIQIINESEFLNLLGL